MRIDRICSLGADYYHQLIKQRKSVTAEVFEPKDKKAFITVNCTTYRRHAEKYRIFSEVLDKITLYAVVK